MEIITNIEAKNIKELEEIKKFEKEIDEEKHKLQLEMNEERRKFNDDDYQLKLKHERDEENAKLCEYASCFFCKIVLKYQHEISFISERGIYRTICGKCKKKIDDIPKEK